MHPNVKLLLPWPRHLGVACFVTNYVSNERRAQNPNSGTRRASKMVTFHNLLIQFQRFDGLQMFRGIIHDLGPGRQRQLDIDTFIVNRNSHRRLEYETIRIEKNERE